MKHITLTKKNIKHILDNNSLITSLIIPNDNIIVDKTNKIIAFFRLKFPSLVIHTDPEDVIEIIFNNKFIHYISDGEKRRIRVSEFEKISFSECTFQGDLEIIQLKHKFSIKLSSCTVEKNFKLISHKDIPIGIELIKTKFKGIFDINNKRDTPTHKTEKYYLKTMTLKGCEFQGNLKIHNTKIEKFSIQNCNFHKIADFYQSEIKSSSSSSIFDSINFHDLAIFENTTFESHAEFRYVTFNEQAIFRGAEFKNGLNLERSNIKSDANFFNVKGFDNPQGFSNHAKKTISLSISITISTFFLCSTLIDKNLPINFTTIILLIPIYFFLIICLHKITYITFSPSISNTSRETFRIIKNHLKNSSDVINANIYHSLELSKKLSEEKKGSRYSLDNIPLLFHSISSNFSQSWLLPLLWIFIVAIFTNIALIFSIDSSDQCSYSPSELCSFSSIIRYATILNSDCLLEKYPLILLLNKASLSYLYYQFIIAVRRNTRQ